jgi:polyisoprenoid-binding protein YceI
MQKKIGILILLILGMPAHADSIEAELKLSPAGGFKATTTEIESDLKRGPKKELLITQVQFTVVSLKTGIKLRDDHLHRFLQKDAHPKLTLSQIRIGPGQGTGQLTLAGQTKPIKFRVIDEGRVAKFDFVLVPTEFGLKPVSYLGIKVKDRVQISGILDVD